MIKIYSLYFIGLISVFKYSHNLFWLYKNPLLIEFFYGNTCFIIFRINYFLFNICFHRSIEEQKEQHKKTIGLMKKLMVCADQTTIENWIMEVLVCTTAQARLTEADLALKWRVYASKLSHIPADILKAACDEICRTSTFFPSLAEFIKYTDTSYHRRVQLVDGILSKVATYSDKNDHNKYLSAWFI